MKFKFIFITFCGCFVLALPFVQPIEAYNARRSNDKTSSEHLTKNLKRFQRQNFKEMSNSDKMAYPDADYPVDSNRNEPEEEEDKWLQPQQSQETSNLFANLKHNERVSLFENENDGDDYDQENGESEHASVDKDDSPANSREKAEERSVVSRKFLQFPKISAEGEKISLNLNLPKGPEQYADNCNTDISGCRQCQQQPTDCSRRNKSDGSCSAHNFNENRDIKSFEFYNSFALPKCHKTIKVNNSAEYDKGKIFKDEDEDDGNWALLKFSIANAQDNQKWSQQPLNDQLENTKNTLSHEADYKLSKMEQDNSADKLGNSFWKWGIFKRSRSFNPMHLIKLKTSERLMKKGFSASLPSFKMEHLRPNYQANNFHNQPLYNENEYASRQRKTIAARNDRYKRDKEKKMINGLLEKPAVGEKASLSSLQTENDKVNVVKDNNNNNQVGDMKPESVLQSLESNNDQELSKVLETSRDEVNLENNLKAFEENFDAFGPHSRRRKRSIDSKTDVKSNTLNALETEGLKKLQKENIKAFKLQEPVKALNFKSKTNIMKNEKALNALKALEPQNSGKKLKAPKRNRGLELLRKPHKSYKLLSPSFLVKVSSKRQNTSKAFSKNKASFNSFKSTIKSSKQNFETKSASNSLSNNSNIKVKLFKNNKNEAQFIENLIENKSFTSETAKESVFKESFQKKKFSASGEKLLSGNKSLLWKKDLKKAQANNENNAEKIRRKRSIDSFYNENHMQQTQPETNRNSKRFSTYFKGANKTQSTEDKAKTDFDLYANDEPLKKFSKLYYKKYKNKAHKTKTSPMFESSLSKPRLGSHNYYGNSFKNRKDHLKNKKSQKISKMYTNALKDLEQQPDLFTDQHTFNSNKPQVAETLKNQYLSDLKNFNQNYKFNEYPIEWSMPPSIRNTNDNKTHSQDDSQSLNLRNEILNCQAFSSLEEFLKSLSQNTTPSAISNNTLGGLEMELSTPAISTHAPTEATFTFNFTSTTTKAYEVPTTCITIPAKEEATEMFTEYPMDDSADDSTETFPEVEDEDAQEANDLKLNISINAKVHGNPLGKDFYGNGSIEMMPGLVNDKKRRDILLHLPKHLEKRKCAQMPTVKPNFIEDSEDIGNLASGKLSAQMVEMIFKRVQNEPTLQDLWPSLKPAERTTEKVTGFYALRNMNNEAEVQHAEELFSQSIAAINKIIEGKLNSQACITLRPDLQAFYNLILHTRQEQELLRAKRDMAKKFKKSDFSQDIRLLNANEIQEKTSTVKKLLREYEALPEHEQKQMLAVKDELLKSLNEFQQLNAFEKRHHRDLTNRLKQISDVSVENVMKTLPNSYTPEFIKLLKAANFYRAIQS